jgi:hypothetical protein
VDNVFAIRIIITVNIIFLFSIIKVVIIFGINPIKGGTPAILIKRIKKFKLLILLSLIVVILWNRKFILNSFSDFVADRVIKE